MIRRLACAAALLCLCACGPAGGGASARPAPRPAASPAPATGLAALAGDWQVGAVHVDPDGVQALSENDPAYMGAVLAISPGRLSWRPHPAGGTLSDVCDGPDLSADGAVHCRSGAFGPPGAKLAKTAGGLTLTWYDGATLTLHHGG